MDGAKWQVFESWLREYGAALPKTEFKESVFGRGVFAKQDIGEWEEIASLPVYMVLATRVARRSYIGRIVDELIESNATLSSLLPRLSHGHDVSQGGSTAITRGRAILCVFMIHGRFVDVSSQDIAKTYEAEEGTSNTTENNDKVEGEEKGETGQRRQSDSSIKEIRASFWRPYFDTLPTTYTTPLWWSMQDLEYLKGTNLLAALEERKNELYECYRLLLPKLSTNHPLLFPKQFFTWENFLWAYTACSSRSFPQHILGPARLYQQQDEEEDQEEELDECLLPGLDMLNHQYKKRISWILDRNGKSMNMNTINNNKMNPVPHISQFWLRFVTEDPIARGSEAFNNYGPKGNEELLLGYGFCIPDNEQDYFMIKLSLPASDPLMRAKQQILRTRQIKSLHTLRKDCLSRALLAALRVIVMNETELYFFDDEEKTRELSRQQQQHQLEQSSSPSPHQEETHEEIEEEEPVRFINYRNEFAMLKLLTDLIMQRIGNLVRTTPVHTNNDEALSFNIRNAIIYRTGQLDVLRASAQLVQQHRDEVGAHQVNEWRKSGFFVSSSSSNSQVNIEPYLLTHELKESKGIIDQHSRIELHSREPYLDEQCFASYIATGTIAKGEAIVTIDEKYLITADKAMGRNHIFTSSSSSSSSSSSTSSSSSWNSELIEALGTIDNIDEETILILFIMHERAAKGHSSTWAFLFETLPNEWNTPLYWTEQELLMFGGQAPLIHQRVTAAREQLESSFNALMSSLRSVVTATSMISYPDVYTFENYMWAATCVQVRGFTLTIDDIEPQLCIVPLPRLPRHHPSATSSFQFHQETRKLEWTSFVDVESGEEVFISYPSTVVGSDTTSLLVQYGYVPRAGENDEFNVIPIELECTAEDTSSTSTTNQQDTMAGSIDTKPQRGKGRGRGRGRGRGKGRQPQKQQRQPQDPRLALLKARGLSLMHLLRGAGSQLSHKIYNTIDVINMAPDDAKKKLEQRQRQSADTSTSTTILQPMMMDEDQNGDESKLKNLIQHQLRGMIESMMHELVIPAAEEEEEEQTTNNTPRDERDAKNDGGDDEQPSRQTKKKKLLLSSDDKITQRRSIRRNMAKEYLQRQREVLSYCLRLLDHQ